MAPLRAVVSLFLLLRLVENVPSLGDPNYSCDPKLMAPSATVPKNVNQVRPADIKVIGVLGDSLTAANGAGAPHSDPLAIVLQYRGLSFHGGGQLELEQQITIPNILKKYNPKLFGHSVGTGSENVWETARLNAGIPGAKSLPGGNNLTGQAMDLVQKIKYHSDKIDIKNDWKLISIFIGGNDVCGWCTHPYNDGDTSPQSYAEGIRNAVKVLKDNLPRTIVQLMGFMHMDLLRQIDNGQFFCQALHVFECHCEADQVSDDDLRNVSISYQIEAQKIEDSQMFDGDDFTFVIQPWFEEVDKIPHVKNESILDFFAPDCFHFSQLGHSIVAHNLWNNMLEPVGQKTRYMPLDLYEPHLSCPDPKCPFYRTHKNSQNCQMTPSALD